MLYKIHSDYGILSWNKVVEPAINLAETGFYPPNRLLKSLKKEKYLWRMKGNNDFFQQINDNPEKEVQNHNYAQTLRVISYFKKI